MEIKNVTLKNIKRSYRRMEDLCMGSDMGWWFCDRRDAIDALGEIQTIGEVLEVGRGLVEYLQQFDYPADCISRALAWLNRWTLAWARA